MRISTVSANFNFKSNDRHLHKNSKGEVLIRESGSYCPAEFDKLVYSNYTNFFRPDLNSGHVSKYYTDGTWNGFCQTIGEHFKDAPKVNVYDFACSDGSEAYSLILSLLDKFGEEEAKKYFPILAYDIDDEMIKVAKSGEIPVCDDDIRRFHYNIQNLNQTDFYKITFQQDSPSSKAFVANEKLRNKVHFQQEDILNALDSIESSNSLILCRNFFPYLSKVQMWEIIGKLRFKLDSTSLVVIGNFDKFTTSAPFASCGFEEVCPLVYRKRC
ncbi:MAG: hypothetical protein IJB79_04330 [Candidatus Gastranaerophilales bacterium]|nr:hypothetical protein [Candidatus Gastranaerophilales bacterium]